MTGLVEAKKFRAFSASCRKNSKTLPRNALLPDLVVRLTTPPLKRPNSAGGLLLSILNSWIASTFGKNATCPGSGCSTEMPSNRYSLVRGRPPLMRGSGAAGGGGSATPGTRLASEMKLRPLSGRSTTLPVVDDVAEPRGLAAEQRRVGRDRDGFGQSAELQLQVQSNGLAGGEPNAFAGQRPESAQLDAHPIGAGREPRDDVTAVLARDGRAGQVGADGDHRDGRAGHGGARLVHHVPRQRPCPNLRADRRRRSTHLPAATGTRVPNIDLRASDPLQ